MKKLFVFACVWSMVGFVTGTATLMGPVRWITDAGRSEGWPEGAEDRLVRLVIVAFVLLSAALAAWLSRIVRETDETHVRVGLPALLLLAATANVWLWLTPELMGGGREAPVEVGSRFTFGPYPDSSRLRELSDQGYAGIVSLLHPAVVPFETKLIRDGQAAAAEAGLEYVHTPMLPWISDNSDALARVGELVEENGGRYYVHCYLGKDRIRVVKGFIEQLDPSIRVEATRGVQAHEERRDLTGNTVWSRGRVVAAGDGVHVTPYPTDDEFMGYVLPGRNGDVVSLLDPENTEDQPWIEAETRLLAGNGHELTVSPIPIRNYDPYRALEVARQVEAMPAPVIVHAFQAAESGRSPAAEAFLQAFSFDLPPLPPSLFTEPINGAPVSIIAPNVALGPRPDEDDFRSYLEPRGIRDVLYLGDDPIIAEEDATRCAAAGIRWRGVSQIDRVETALSKGGPWYVYGPRLESMRANLASQLGPPMPTAHVVPPAPEPERTTVAEVPALLEAIPSVRQLVLLGPVLALFAGLAGCWVGRLHARSGVATPYTRKIFHFAIFTSAGVLHIYGGFSAVALFGAIVSTLVLYAVWRGEGFPLYEAMARPSDAPRRTLFVLIPLATTAIGGMTANLAFGAFAYIGYLVAGWGDAIAEPVGTRWGRHRYRVPSLAGVPAERSLEGSLAVCLVGGLAAFFGLWLYGVEPVQAVLIAMACGLAGAAVEAVSNHGLDNLTVQLAASGVAFFLLS